MGSRLLLVFLAFASLCAGCSRPETVLESTPKSPAVAAKFGRDAASFSEEPMTGNQRCVRLVIRDAEQFGPLCFLPDVLAKSGIHLLFSTANTPRLVDQFVAGFASRDIGVVLKFDDKSIPMDIDPATGFFAFRIQTPGLLQRVTASRGSKVITVCERSDPQLYVDLDCITQ
jgi:hypothetical protein